MMRAVLLPLLLLTFISANSSTPTKGFFLPDTLTEVTFRYKRHNNLIIISPVLNDSIQLNLILDTGCNNIVLFGKKYLKYFNPFESSILFSGLGNGQAAKGHVSIDNNFKINGIEGKLITVVVVPQRRNFIGLTNIDGFIGFDLLSKFEIEVNPSASLITFRSALDGKNRHDFKHFKLLSGTTYPLIESSFVIDNEIKRFPLLIDTGSELGFLFRSKNYANKNEDILGVGINGIIYGTTVSCKELKFESTVIGSEFLASATERYGNISFSVGMEFLENYVFVLNFVKGYFLLKDLKLKEEILPPTNPLNVIVMKSNPGQK
jgi:hypothetical protein